MNNDNLILEEVLERIKMEARQAAAQEFDISEAEHRAHFRLGWEKAAMAEFSRWGIHPVHPVFKGWDSTRLIGGVKRRFQELVAKGWHWMSFYNGWLEGRSEMLQEGQKEWDGSSAKEQEGRENENEACLLLKNLIEADMALTHIYSQGIMSGSAFLQAQHKLGMAKRAAQRFLQSQKQISNDQNVKG